MDEVLRIAMWSGPRNLSTALMRSFGSRKDVSAVIDEPFYAAYLAASGKAHPMRDEVVASQSQDWRVVAQHCQCVGEAGVVYQKHMAQHMLAEFSWDWAMRLRNCFLIREPERVAASFLAAWPRAGLEDLGFVQQVELFDRLADQLGHAPPVIDAATILHDPATAMPLLCEALGLGWDENMLRWSPGLRHSDGVWAAHWYASVEHSTGFAAPEARPPVLDAAARRLADAARPYYERLAAYRIESKSAQKSDR